MFTKNIRQGLPWPGLRAGLLALAWAAAWFPALAQSALPVVAPRDDLVWATARVTEEETRLDMQASGKPASAAKGLVFDSAEARQWARVLAPFAGPVAARVALASYRDPDEPAGMLVIDSLGTARRTDTGCRLIMSHKALAELWMAKTTGASRLEVQTHHLAELAAVHELGHCQTILGLVSPTLPGTTEQEHQQLDRSIFNPAWGFLDQAGRPSRLWSESFADAFMAIEYLALATDRPQAITDLALVAQGRTLAKDTDVDHSNGSVIQMALRAAQSWAGIRQQDRLQAAATLATIAGLLEQAQADPRRSDGDRAIGQLNPYAVGHVVTVDACFQWIAAEGVEARYHMQSFGLGHSKNARELEGILTRMALTAKSALQRVAGQQGIQWAQLKPDSSAVALVNLALKDPELQSVEAELFDYAYLPPAEFAAFLQKMRQAAQDATPR